MKNFVIQPVTIEDEGMLCDLFLEHITRHPEYISHGEIQMGVGVGHFDADHFTARPSSQARSFWMKYIHGNVTDSQTAAVFKAVDGTDLLGFCVVEINEDGAAPFGMICDVLVRENTRQQGVGSALLEQGIAWLRSQGIQDIYLESGLHNHAAHAYFCRRGFAKVSEIYKLR